MHVRDVAESEPAQRTMRASSCACSSRCSSWPSWAPLGPLVAVFAVAALVVPVAVTSWHVSLAKSFDDVTPVAIPVAALAMFAAVQVFRGNRGPGRGPGRARPAGGRERADPDRPRPARPARPLADDDHGQGRARAAARRDRPRRGPAARSPRSRSLARQALADMRAAVHELPGRDARRRAGDRAGAAARRRHRRRAAARGSTWSSPRTRSCSAGSSAKASPTSSGTRTPARAPCGCPPSSVEIVDDGVGGSAAAGNGLSGLRERVAAAGGVVEAGPLQPRGWRLRVSLAGRERRDDPPPARRRPGAHPPRARCHARAGR